MSIRPSFLPSLIFAIVLSVAATPGASAIETQPAPRVERGRSAAPAAPRPAPVILVSLDGFRRDYLERYDAPAIARLAREGTRADGMRPAFPSITFPAHHTLATGRFPQEHRILANRVPDPTGGDEPLTMNSETPSWWQWHGEPIWVTAEKQGLKAAAMFWPASYAAIDGRRPTYARRPYDAKVPYEERVAQVLDWLDLPDDRRPSFITLYFEAVDAAGHAAGPFSDQCRAAVARVDAALALLVGGLEQRRIFDKVNIIVTADHGMSEVPAGGEHAVVLADTIDPASITTEGAGPFMFVEARDGNQRAMLARLRKVPHVRSFLKKDIPKPLHFRQHPRPFSLFLVADDGWSIVKEKTPELTRQFAARAGTVRGEHGYDPTYPSMKALFVARGPGFRAGTRLPEFDSVHVYSLLTHLLRIAPAPNSGRIDPFVRVLAEKPGKARAGQPAGTR